MPNVWTRHLTMALPWGTYHDNHLQMRKPPKEFDFPKVTLLYVNN